MSTFTAHAPTYPCAPSHTPPLDLHAALHNLGRINLVCSLCKNWLLIGRIWCFLCFWSLETRFRFVCNHVHSCSIRVHSCSIRVHSCALVFHSCSLVCARVPFVFTRVRSCSLVCTRVLARVEF